MKDWNGWTDKQRRASIPIIKKAIANGEMQDPQEVGCARCGQKEGIIDCHTYDYDDPVNCSEPLCYRCHMVLHNEHNNPEACKKYWDDVAQGKCYPPTFKRNQFFSIMWELGIFTGKRKAAK